MKFLLLKNLRQFFSLPLHESCYLIHTYLGNGWQWGKSAGQGDMAVCVNKEPWAKYCVEPPCGQLNPVNENMYKVLGEIYKDMLDVFDNDLFHMGGDEVNLQCWNDTEEIVNHLTAQGKELSEETFIELWANFQDKGKCNRNEKGDFCFDVYEMCKTLFVSPSF